MHHLLVYSGSVAQNAALANIPAIVDQVFPAQTSTNYLPPMNLKLLRLYAMADAVSQVRLDSPLLRPIGPPQIQPVDDATEPSTYPPINKYDENALNWATNDPLGILCSRAGAGAAVCYAACWVAPNVQTKISGPTWPVRCTFASTTLTASSWVPQNLTFDQSLPPGRYKIVGMSAVCPDLFAARLVMPNQIMRPGVIAQDASAQFDWEWFRRGEFGDFGEFESTAPPTVELMGHTAGAETGFVWLDLQPMSGQTPRF